MIRIGRWTITGPVSALRALREPPFRNGQIRHYEPRPGVGSWAISSEDLTRGRGLSGRVSRWLRILVQPEPRPRAVTPPPSRRDGDSGEATGPKG